MYVQNHDDDHSPKHGEIRRRSTIKRFALRPYFYCIVHRSSQIPMIHTAVLYLLFRESKWCGWFLLSCGSLNPFSQLIEYPRFPIQFKARVPLHIKRGNYEYFPLLKSMKVILITWGCCWRMSQEYELHFRDHAAKWHCRELSAREYSFVAQYEL